jgi:hypothetical protein
MPTNPRPEKDDWDDDEQEAAPSRPANTLLAAALSYAGRGWHVFPLHTPERGRCSCRRLDCTNTGKHPRTANGLTDATADVEKIERWWGMWPAANIGIACGPSNLVAIDIDPRHGGEESLSDLRARIAWPNETASTVTGSGGQHYLFRANANTVVRNSSGLLGPGIDVRGDGGYIVAPPSLHASGRTYEWECDPADTTLAVYPDELASFAKPRRAEPSETGGIILEGKRNEGLTRLAGSMRRQGMGEGAILAALREENLARCRPPLPDSEVMEIARSVARYAPNADVPVRVVAVTEYRNLRKIETDPPVYLVDVSGRDVKVPMAELRRHSTLRTAIAEQVDHLVPPLKTEEWDSVLSRLLSTVEHIPVPDDSSEPGLLWGIARDFLLATAKDDEERFAQGQPVEKEGTIYASGAILREGLKARGMMVDQRKLYAVMSDHGMTARTERFRGRQARTWAFNRAALEKDSGNDSEG